MRTEAEIEQGILDGIQHGISAYRRIPVYLIDAVKYDSVVTGNVVLGVAEYQYGGATDWALYAAHPFKSDSVVILSRIGEYDASVWRESIEKLLQD